MEGNVCQSLDEEITVRRIKAVKLMYCIGSMAARAGMENILFHKAKKLAVDYGIRL